MRNFTHTWQKNWSKKFSKHLPFLVAVIIFGLGTLFIFNSHAATPTASLEAENGTLSSAASAANDTSASGGQAVKFGSSATASCSGSPNTPGGADPWGGCWPGPSNTGVPANVTLVDVSGGNINPPNSQLSSDNTNWHWDATNGFIRIDGSSGVIDGVDTKGGGVYIASGQTAIIKNSAIGVINQQGTVNIEHSTINGGGQWTLSAVAGGSNITVDSSNISNGEHGIICYGNCVVTNNYIHDNADGSAAGAHQNGFLSVNGSGFTLTHNAVSCTGGCTADIAFLDQSTNSDAQVTKNLLLASVASYCAYPGPNSSSGSASNMVWKNNVFQKGANDKGCTYGPVYGWYPGDGTGNVWSGNVWDDGTPLDE